MESGFRSVIIQIHKSYFAVAKNTAFFSEGDKYLIAKFLSHAQDAHGHAIFCHRIGNVILEPYGSHTQWRRYVENVRMR